MRQGLWISLYVLMGAGSMLSQTNTFPFVIKTVAGTFPLGDGGPATSALLFNPQAAVADAQGNLYILDSKNYRIRKVAGGTISTVYTLNFYGNDMKMAPDGSFYISAAGQIVKLSPAGSFTMFAGTGTPGFSGDEGPATSAQVGSVLGLALDATGDVYFADGNRIREVTVDGKIHTIAGTGTAGYTGDGGFANKAQLNAPFGVAVDQTGNIYISDQGNFVVREMTLGGRIATIVGNGNYGKPLIGPATDSVLGSPAGLAVDGSGNLYVTDASVYGAVLELSGGNLALFAGTLNSFGPSPDGRAVGSSLQTPVNVSLDSNGDVFIVDQGTQRVREVTPDTFIHTVAGRAHFSGDGGPATSALLNQPTDVVVDAAGDILIADSYNYRIRKVTPDGTINTFGGTGTLGQPGEGASAVVSPLSLLNAMTTDNSGNMFLSSGLEVLSITPVGVVGLVAGNGAPGNTGDGGPALQATFQSIAGVAVDAGGNVYIADSAANRVREVAVVNRTIGPFAGTGTQGYAGDGLPAANALLNLTSGGGALAVDSLGNLYIADNGNFVIRMVSAAKGSITTVVGNGTFGHPTDGQPATSTPFSGAAGMTFDSAGSLYITSQAFGETYRVTNGVIQRVAGGGSVPLAEGIVATTTTFFGQGIKVDAGGNAYIADSTTNVVRKLVVNTPVSAAILSGNHQTALTNQALPNPLKVMVTGSAGSGVPGVAVTFAVTEGLATLSPSVVKTDNSGIASIVVTLGVAPGVVTVTATADVPNATPIQFTATATAGGACLPLPSIKSVQSASEFGGFSTFGSGSWLEIKGLNLATDTRQWAGGDFQGANAPTSLDGSSVSIDGIPGFVAYISPTQINVQAPADATIGPVQISVTNCAGASAPVTVQKVAAAPGMLAPPSFTSGGKQYMAALFQDGVTFVGTAGLVSGTAFRPAAPGDAITAYGVGFGSVTPSIAPGVVVSQQNSIANLTVSFGSSQAATSYAGLAPGNIGLYQFDITVPNVPDGDYQINITAGGVQVAQTLYLTVHH